MQWSINLALDMITVYNFVNNLIYCDIQADTYLRHSIIRDAIPLLLIILNTQMRLIPQTAGSGTVEQHQALCRSNIAFSPSEPSGNGSSITLQPYTKTLMIKVVQISKKIGNLVELCKIKISTRSVVKQYISHLNPNGTPHGSGDIM